METLSSQNAANPKYLLEQLLIARKEINNLRQQIRSLRYVHERDVSSIKKLLETPTSAGVPCLEESAAAASVTSTSDFSGFSSSTNSDPTTSVNSNNQLMHCRPIGKVETWFPNKKGVPRQPVICGNAPGKLTLFKSIFTNPEHSLQGLEEFSHMWILFHFHKNEMGHIRAKVAPPRLNGLLTSGSSPLLKTGVFSTRSPHRPCPIGLSLVKIIKIQDSTIYFEGVDMVDQTPVLDIKPYIPHYDNPAYVERILQSTHLKQDSTNIDVAAATSFNDQFDENVNSTLTDEKNTNKNNTSFMHSSLSSSSSSSLNDISRDQEIAMRLQVQEYQSNLNFEDMYINNDNSTTVEDRELEAIIKNTQNLNAITYNDAAQNGRSDHYNRNPRMLDGADSTNVVCTADMDFINRRALNLRLNDSSSSSPVRMDMREAPDGEENFDLQQIPGINNSINANDDSSSFIDENLTDAAVRVPDWISRPRTSQFTVVFNERSLMQMHEILKDKADETKCAVENVLKEDPRSVYLRQRYGNQFYTFLIHELHITCRFDDDRRLVSVFQVRHASRSCECGKPEWQCTSSTCRSRALTADSII